MGAVLRDAVRARGTNATRSFKDRFGEVINVDDFYAQGEIPGTDADADTAAFQAAILKAEEINGGTIFVPPCDTPRLINETLVIGFKRRTADSATYPDVPVSSDTAVRHFGSIRIAGPGCGLLGSIFEQSPASSGEWQAPATLRYVGTGDGLLDIVSAYNVHISGLMLENGATTAEFITRVRSYLSPAPSSTIVTFRDCVYSLNDPLGLRTIDGDRGAQHTQQDCKHVRHINCVWLHGEDNDGNLMPCVRLGEDTGVTGGLIGGSSILPYFESCTFQGDVIFRWVLDGVFRNVEHYPRRPIADVALNGTGRFLFDGNKIVSGLELDNVCSDGDSNSLIDEVYFDATGANLRNLRVSGHYRVWDTTFILDGYGPYEFAATFNNPGSGAVDIEIAATATGHLYDRSDHSLTVGAGRTAIDDNRTENIDVQRFTASGTWTKPTAAKFVDVTCTGCGGGGGGGGKTAAGADSSGGGGGGGAGRVTKRFLPSEIGATATVTIGAAGSSGAGATVDGPGANGTAGGSASFGGLLVAFGGGRGSCGNLSTASGGGGGGGPRAVGGDATAGTGGTITSSIFGTAGGSGIASLTATSPTGGSGGGGCSNVCVAGVASSAAEGACGGAAGGGVVAANTFTVGQASVVSFSTTSALGGATDGAAGGPGVDQTIRAAGGGGGGAGSVAGTGGAGGVGGAPGGGGGGGGGTHTGTGGAGGNGGRGEVLVVTYF